MAQILHFSGNITIHLAFNSLRSNWTDRSMKENVEHTPAHLYKNSIWEKRDDSHSISLPLRIPGFTFGQILVLRICSIMWPIWLRWWRSKFSLTITYNFSAVIGLALPTDIFAPSAAILPISAPLFVQVGRINMKKISRGDVENIIWILGLSWTKILKIFYEYNVGYFGLENWLALDFRKRSMR